MGLLQYLQKFIPAIAQHTRPLTALLPPNVAAEKAWIACQCVLSQGQHPKTVLLWVWRWTTEASAAFQILKQEVMDISGLRPLDHAAALSGKALIYLFTGPAQKKEW